MQKLRDIAYLARDFASVVRGTDYFHQPQPLGRYFVDNRCYYNDLRGKADWQGPLLDGVPQLYIPTLRTSVQFPIMVLQYGLGSADRWFEAGDDRFRQQANAAVSWVVSSLNTAGAFANYFPDLLPENDFHSDNSAMAQGEALSLLSRAVRYDIVDGNLKHRAEAAANRIAANMLRPLDEGGTCLREGPSVYLCEQCRVDSYVVLNGWVFALFGLHDYCEWRGEGSQTQVLHESLNTLARKAGDFLRPDGWSKYDNLSRTASPFYHHLHIAQFDALHRLFGEPRISDVLHALQRANTRWNRLCSTAGKVKDKLVDRSRYATTGPRQVAAWSSSAA